ncbi:Efflux pump [Podosphaera aphanis]|nr:Efflux pump [Podosphaera aphanis]
MGVERDQVKTVKDEEIAPESRVSDSITTLEANSSALNEETKGKLSAENQDDSERLSTLADASPVRQITGWKWALIVTAILSSTFLFALDNTIVAVVQPVVVLEFNSIDRIAWLSSSFLLTAAATNLIWGKVFGQLEAKWTYIFCVAMFELGSVICGAAPDMNSMIIGRAIAGVGGSGMYVGVMTLLAVNTSIKERPMYIGATGMTWGLGTVFGPIIGGALTVSTAGWRWAFYINLCIGALCFPVYIFMIPRCDPRPGVSFVARAREMDYVGGVLTIGAFVSGVTAISFGGVQYDWLSSQIIGLFSCSFLCFMLLGTQQAHMIFTTKARRVFPVEFFQSRTMLLLFASTAAGGTSIFTPIYMIPLLFQYTRGDTALQAGVRLLPFIAVTIFAVIVNGASLSIHGLYMPWFLVGGILSIIGGSLMFTVTSTTSIAAVYGYSAIIGLGAGLYAQSGFSIAQAIVEIPLVPLAIGFITCAQVTGVTIALAIANSVFLNKSISGIKIILPEMPSAQIKAAISGAGSPFVASLEPEVRVKVIEAIVRADSTAYLLIITAGVVAMISSFLMKRERLFITPGAA